MFTKNGNAGVAQLVEHQPSKLGVEGSSLFARSIFLYAPAGAGFFLRWIEFTYSCIDLDK
jgi:hypothetical protein